MYERLLVDAEQAGVHVVEKWFKSSAKGFCKEGRIGISKGLRSTSERTCILAEELGHFHTTIGNILDQSDVCNRKQERRARAWSYHSLIPLHQIYEAHRAGAHNRYELAEELGVTEEYLQDAWDYYQTRS